MILLFLLIMTIVPCLVNYAFSDSIVMLCIFCKIVKMYTMNEMDKKIQLIMQYNLV